MRQAGMLLAAAVALGVIACGGRQVPQHSGYKGKKPTPWTKAKSIELDDEYKAKFSGELDYGEYKRAKWYKVTLPGSGDLAISFEFVPGGEGDIDVAFEVLDPNNKVLVSADNEAEDVFEQKKERKLTGLNEGTYLIHVFLEGRLDNADFDVKLAFTRGPGVWKSDFPNQVAFLDELPAVAPFDDTPEKATPPQARCGVKGKPACVRRPPPPPPPCKPPDPKCGLAPLSASITNVDPDPAGARISIGAGTSDNVNNGMAGYVVGVKGGSFRLNGCTVNRCTAVVKASVDAVRASGDVVIKR